MHSTNLSKNISLGRGFSCLAFRTQEGSGCTMKMFIRVWISSLAAIQLFSVVQGNGYYGSDDKPQSSLSANRPVPSALPQYESAGADKDKLWWLKAENNPFQKPPNHPGVEQGESQSSQPQPQSPAPKPYNNPISPCGQPACSQHNAGTYSNRPSPSQPQVISTFQSSSYQVQIPESPDCLLRNKADCHSTPSSNTVQTGVSFQQVQPFQGYPSGESVPQTLNVPSTGYNPPKYDSYSPPAPIPHGPTPPPLPQPNRPVQQSYQPLPNPKPIDLNYQQSQVTFGPSSNGQYDPKPYIDFNTQYQPSNPNPRPAQPNSYNQGNGDINAEVQPPYPGCPAAMLCVPEDHCNADGVDEGKPTSLSPAEKLYRVALMACSFPKTGEVGVCCRDPNYKDPWPDMGAGHEHHPKDSSGGHGHNDGQYRPTHNNGQYQPINQNNGHHNPGQQLNPGISSQQTQATQNIPGSGYSSTGCRPSY